jgi:hypothetical protein
MVGKGGQVALPKAGNTANPMVCCRMGRVQAAVLAGTTQAAGTTSVLGSWSWRQWEPVRSASKKGASGNDAAVVGCPEAGRVFWSCHGRWMMLSVVVVVTTRDRRRKAKESSDSVDRSLSARRV